MLSIAIPGQPALSLRHLVLDFNGTLARDGAMLPGVVERLDTLQQHLDIHVITADTHGTVRDILAEVPVELHILAPEEQDRQKEARAPRRWPP